MNLRGGQPLFLVGFMGCGKTTLGRALATALGVPFVDLDDEICRRSGADSVNDIFARQGEAAFRALETETLRSFVQSYTDVATQLQSGARDAIKSDTTSATKPEMTSTAASTIPSAIIACGGGTPCHADNMDVMLQGGTVIWLDADEDCLIRRLTIYGDSRPLVRDLDAEQLRRYVRQTLAQRSAHYGRAHQRFDSSRLEDAEQVAASVRLFIDTFILT